jgi:hypothetical protein
VGPDGILGAVPSVPPGVDPRPPATPPDPSPGRGGSRASDRPGAAAFDAGLALGAAGVALTLCWLCFGFTADDAFIYMRYGANLVERGELVYNAGEWVSSMTSPAMALAYAALHATSDDPRLAYKLLALALLALTAGLAWRSGGGDRRLALAVTLVAVLSPCVVVWTLGGMETPMLMALAACLTALATGARRRAPAAGVAACALAGLGFLMRYDAALYTAPIAVFCLLPQRWSARLLGLALFAALPVAWTAVALRLYGDVLPTSFYVKTPSARPDALAANALYMAEYLLVTGLVPLAAFLAAAGGGARRLARGVRELWGPWAGLALVLGYGLTSATTHMMFAFRYFVPYLPSAAMLLAVAWLRGAPAPERDSRTRSRAFALLLVALLASQAAQGAYSVFRSVNGIVSVGELRATSVRDLTVAIERSQDLARRIREHWAARGVSAQPTIATFAEGALPYAYRAARVYGGLLSYRRDCPWSGPFPAHYSILSMPASRDRGPGEWRDAQGRLVISTEPLRLEGRSVVLAARFDQSPQPARLPPRVRGPCVDPRQTR